MARKTIGHVELQWTCPNCGGINPGPVKVCQSCGAPQPEDVKFEQAVRQELITDEEKLAQAEAGADIHCPYCGARNPAGAETCSQCGGDLVEGVQRESGQVVGAFVSGPEKIIKCPRCGAENSDVAKALLQQFMARRDSGGSGTDDGDLHGLKISPLNSNTAIVASTMMPGIDDLRLVPSARME